MKIEAHAGRPETEEAIVQPCPHTGLLVVRTKRWNWKSLVPATVEICTGGLRCTGETDEEGFVTFVVSALQGPISYAIIATAKDIWQPGKSAREDSMRLLDDTSPPIHTLYKKIAPNETKSIVVPCGAPHVVVVGGGMAGLAAARDLIDADIRVTMIEAQAVLGGRAHTDISLGTPFDHGCQWVQNDLVIDYADGLGIRTRNLAVEQDQVVYLYLPDTKKFSTTKYDKALFENIDGEVDDDDILVKIRKSIETFNESIDYGRFSTCDSTEGDDEESVEDNKEGEEKEDKKEEDEKEEENSDGADGADTCCKVPKGGYGSLIAKCAEVIVRMGRDLLTVSKSTKVTNIEHIAENNDLKKPDIKVTVSPVAGGASHDILANAVIVTASTTVLANEVIEFKPPIADVAEFSKIPLGHYIKVGLKFKTNIFEIFFRDNEDALDDGATKFTAITDQTFHREHFVYMVDTKDEGVWKIQMQLPASNIVVLIASGTFAENLCGLAKDVVRTRALAQLKSMLGDELVDTNVIDEEGSCSIAEWTSNEFVGGAYSYTALDGEGVRDQLKKVFPWKRLKFAGEALWTPGYGTVQAALLSGRYAAKEIMDELENK